jgi:hypothetical protein
MKRIKIVGLCVMVACAFAAVSGASSASAAEFGVCIAKKKSHYANSSCTTLPAKAGKGGYEWEPAGACYANKKSVYTESKCETVATKKGVPDHKGGFEKAPLLSAVVSGGTGELRSAAGTIKCTSSSGFQQITGPKTLVAQTVFHGCETQGQKCQNTANEGEIATFELDGTLTEPAAGEASVKLTGTGSDGKGGPSEGHYLAEFGCTNVAAVRVHGELGDRVTPTNVSGTSELTTFAEGVEQGLISEFGPASFNPSETLTLPSEQIGTVTATTSTPGEIHAP